MFETLTGLSDVNQLVDWYRSLGATGVVMASLTMMTCALTVLPAEISAIANAMVYGPFWGALLSWSSALVGANVAFVLARGRAGQIVTRLVGRSRMEDMQSWTRENGMLALFIANLIPIVPFFVVNYVGGLSGMRWTSFNVSTGLGILPAISLLGIMGDRALELPLSACIGLAGAVVAVIVGAKLFARHGARLEMLRA